MQIYQALVFAFLFFVGCTMAQIEGFPAQVCGSQSFDTSYVSGGSITFNIETTSNVILSTNTVTYTDTNVVEMEVTCQGRGPAELFYTTEGRNIEETVRFYCAGVISVSEAPAIIARGSEFSLDLFLSPTPVEPVQIIVESLSALITPGSERVVFGVEQSLANEIFYVPKAFVGPAEILFRSRSLRDYNGPGCTPLSVQMIVQGELASSLEGGVYPTDTTVPVTVSLSPAFTEDVVITIDTTSGSAPATVTVNSRENEVSFDFTVSADPFATDACVTFSSPYYASVTSCFEVIGGFSSDIPAQLNTFAVETFGVTALPSPSEDMIITIETTSNVSADAQVHIAAGDSTGFFQIDALTAGEGWIDFSAPNYVKQRFFFTIIEVVCAENELINQFGTECLSCPSLDGVICSGRGQCGISPSVSEQARCECEEGFTGGYCEYEESEIERYGGDSVTTYSKPFPSISTLTVSLPESVLALVTDGYFLVWPATTTFVPTVENNLVSLLPGGFSLYAVAADNTIVESFDLFPVRAVFEFDRTMSQKEILQQVLFYKSASGWIPAIDACPPQFQLSRTDLIQRTSTVNLCTPGQYQFYQVSPIPSHAIAKKGFFPVETFVYDDLSVYYSNQGLGRAEVAEPPQPTFAPVHDEAITSESYTDTQTVDSDFISLTSPESTSSSSSSSSSNNNRRNFSAANTLTQNGSLVLISSLLLSLLAFI